MSDFAMPAEWATHERTLVAWPVRVELWGDQLAAAKTAHANVITAIARFEPVLVVVAPGAREEARAACAGDHAFDVEVVEEPIDDSWLRDSGPIVVRDAVGNRAAVDFRFNGWGEKYTPFAADDAVAARLCARLGIPCDDASIVLEGGAITVDGAGRLVTTEQCLLHANRNPGLGRSELEAVLRERLGVDEIVWLAAGLVEDRDTDGHVDNVCTFVAPGVALVQGTPDDGNPNAATLADNRARLEDVGVEVIPIDVLPYDVVGGRRVVVPPLNCYQVNGGVIVPVADGDPAAADASVAAIAAALPGREVLGVGASVLAYGGGGVHCITQQIPA
jgi:agmatine deiminase